MMLRFDSSGSRASIGCGLLLLFLGIVLLSPFVGWLISLLTDLLGWILIVVGLIGVVVGVLSWMSGTRRAD